MKLFRKIIWYLRPRAIKNYFKYIVFKRDNLNENMSSDTNISLDPQSSGEIRYIWWHEWEDREKVHDLNNGVLNEKEEKL